MKKVTNILLLSIFLFSGFNGCKNKDEDVSFNEFVLKSIKAYQDIDSFSLNIEYKDSDNEFDINYDYNYKDKTVHYIQNGEDSYDFYSSLINYDYYEFYNDDNKYIKVNKEDNAYLKWNNIIVNNNTYLNTVNNLGYQLFGILDDIIRDEKGMYEDYFVSYELKGSSLNGTFNKNDRDYFTFEFNDYILTSFDYNHVLTGILGDTNTVSKYKINLKDHTDIKRPKIKDYTLMKYNEVFSNEVSKDILLSYLNNYGAINDGYQIEVTKVNWENDNSSKLMKKEETTFQLDYFNKRLYFKSNEDDIDTEIFIYINDENGILLYDMKNKTYKTITLSEYNEYCYTGVDLYYNYYQTLLVYENNYIGVMNNDDYKVYSNNSIDFDVTYNGLSKSEIYKFENNLLSYYYLEQPFQYSNRYEEVKVKYNKALSIPSFEGYVGG